MKFPKTNKRQISQTMFPSNITDAYKTIMKVCFIYVCTRLIRFHAVTLNGDTVRFITSY